MSPILTHDSLFYAQDEEEVVEEKEMPTPENMVSTLNSETLVPLSAVAI